MELGLSTLGVTVSGTALGEVAVRAEAAGYSSIWTAEAWGNDAFTPLAFMAARTSTIRLGTAVAQLGARTPATTGMTALTLQQLSGGRLMLGLGVSGPQVIEGWHGVPFRKPLATTRDYVAILRQVLAGQDRVEYSGEMLSVPYTGPNSTGMGRSLRTTMPPAPDTPILIAALGPKNTALAVEIGNGLLPYLWSPHHWAKVWGAALENAGDDFHVAPTVVAAVGDDIGACRDEVRPRIALHVGGMGTKDSNFYTTLVRRYGYEEVATQIQDRWLAGDRAGAVAAVTDELVDDLALVGPSAHIADQLAVWRTCPIGTLIVEPVRTDSIEQIAAAW